MDTPISIQELFYPLGQRLFEFESGNYTRQATIEVDQFGNTFLSSYKQLADEIGALASKFPSDEVLKVCTEYKVRIESIYESLLDVEIENVHYEHDGSIDVKKTSTKRKEFWKNWHQKELSYYLNMVSTLINSRDKLPSGTGLTSNSKVIELPGNFSMTDLQKDFNSKLTPDQVALLLYLLRDLKYIPEYSDNSLAKLSQHFFGRHEQRVRKGFSEINTVRANKQHKAAVKEMLQLLIDHLD